MKIIDINFSQYATGSETEVRCIVKSCKSPVEIFCIIKKLGIKNKLHLKSFYKIVRNKYRISLEGEGSNAETILKEINNENN